MKYYIFLLSLVFAFNASSAESENIFSQELHLFEKALYSVKLPPYMQTYLANQENDTNTKIKKTNDYSLMPLMEALPHLKIKEGYVLDFVQCGSRMGSRPILYTRKINAERFPDWFIDKSFNAKADLKADNEWENMLLAEPSPESVWEAVLLAELGFQFNLWWHSGYEQKEIVDNLTVFFAESQESLFTKRIRESIIGEKYDKLQKWEFKPRVEMNGNSGTAYYCTFSPFRGFSLLKRKVSFDNWKVSIAEAETIDTISYYCGIRY